jgi:NADPH-dependent curcumin reductase CurA
LLNVMQRLARVQFMLQIATALSIIATHPGINNASEGLVGLFEGKSFGKAVLEVSKL